MADAVGRSSLGRRQYRAAVGFGCYSSARACRSGNTVLPPRARAKAVIPPADIDELAARFLAVNARRGLGKHQQAYVTRRDLRRLCLRLQGMTYEAIGQAEHVTAKRAKWSVDLAMQNFSHAFVAVFHHWPLRQDVMAALKRAWRRAPLDLAALPYDPEVADVAGMDREQLLDLVHELRVRLDG